MDADPSEDILLARRQLHTLKDYKLLEDLKWHEETGRWILKCQLTHSSRHELVPPVTQWVILIDPNYPHGSIQVHPAAKGGLTHTFPHQTYNAPGKYEWRTGNLCLEDHLLALGRNRLSEEVRNATGRLKWHVQRALIWLGYAANDRLLAKGQPLELPPLPPSPANELIAFQENEQSYISWKGSTNSSGYAEFSFLNPLTLILRRFTTHQGEELLSPKWGTSITELPTERSVAMWIQIKELPTHVAWHLPSTWGQLVEVLQRQDIDLLEALSRGVMRSQSRQPSVLLLGFPIMDLIGDQPSQLHWMALRLPEWSTATTIRPGWRHTPKSLWKHDQATKLRPHLPLTWLKSEHWATEQISTRGKASATLRTQRVAIIGVGALGSLVAEALIRLGVHQVLLVDGDTITAGNLVRHNLSMTDVGKNKAHALAEKLNAAGPHATVTAQLGQFPPVQEDDIQNLQTCTVIIDCTAEDQVAQDMGSFDWRTPKLFISCSVSIRALRLYLFTELGTSFSVSKFDEYHREWIQADVAVNKMDFPREGIGCWHPVFPARFDDFLLWSAVTARHLEAVLKQPAVDAQLSVYEQQPGDYGINNVRLISNELD